MPFQSPNLNFNCNKDNVRNEKNKGEAATSKPDDEVEGLEAEDDTTRKPATVVFIKNGDVWALSIQFDTAGFRVEIKGKKHSNLLVPCYKKTFGQASGDKYTWGTAGQQLDVSLPPMNEISVSPSQVRDIARQNSGSNENYITGSNDSKTWVISAANAICRYAA